MNPSADRGQPVSPSNLPAGPGRRRTARSRSRRSAGADRGGDHAHAQRPGEELHVGGTAAQLVGAGPDEHHAPVNSPAPSTCGKEKIRVWFVSSAPKSVSAQTPAAQHRTRRVLQEGVGDHDPEGAGVGGGGHQPDAGQVEPTSAAGPSRRSTGPGRSTPGRTRPASPWPAGRRTRRPRSRSARSTISPNWNSITSPVTMPERVVDHVDLAPEPGHPLVQRLAGAAPSACA